MAMRSKAGVEPGRGAVIDSLKVYEWWTQELVAQAIGRTARTVQNLELKGMPYRGERGTKDVQATGADLRRRVVARFERSVEN